MITLHLRWRHLERDWSREWNRFRTQGVPCSLLDRQTIDSMITREAGVQRSIKAMSKWIRQTRRKGELTGENFFWLALFSQLESYRWVQQRCESVCVNHGSLRLNESHTQGERQSRHWQYYWVGLSVDHQPAPFLLSRATTPPKKGDEPHSGKGRWEKPKRCWNINTRGIYISIYTLCSRREFHLPPPTHLPPSLPQLAK